MTSQRFNMPGSRQLAQVGVPPSASGPLYDERAALAVDLGAGPSLAGILPDTFARRSEADR